MALQDPLVSRLLPDSPCVFYTLLFIHAYRILERVRFSSSYLVAFYHTPRRRFSRRSARRDARRHTSTLTAGARRYHFAFSTSRTVQRTLPVNMFVSKIGSLQKVVQTQCLSPKSLIRSGESTPSIVETKRSLSRSRFNEKRLYLLSLYLYFSLYSPFF